MIPFEKRHRDGGILEITAQKHNGGTVRILGTRATGHPSVTSVKVSAIGMVSPREADDIAALIREAATHARG